MAGRPLRLVQLTAVISLGFIYAVPASAGTTGEEDMVVSADPVGSDDLWDITIVSRVDELRVSSVAVNRGNCMGMPQGVQLPHVLRFGESLRYRALFCHPIEATIEANGQSEVFNFGASFEGKDLNVSADIYGGFGYKNLLTITSYTDIYLSRVTINRGNCGAFGDRKIDPPRDLHFGDYYTVMSFPCRPIEVTLTTDKGPITVQMK